MSLIVDGLARWDWPTAAGLILVGMVAGAVLIPVGPPVLIPYDRKRSIVRRKALALTLITSVGLTFFVFVFTFRTLAGIPTASQVFTTAAQWLTFCVGLAMGSSARDRRIR